MAGMYELIDGLKESVARLTEIERRVRPPVIVPTRTYLPRARLGSPGWWETLTGWIGGIEKWTGPLINLYQQLAQAGVITPAQAQQALSKEELIALIKGLLEEEKKPWWESPWLPVAISVGVVGGATVYYVARKPRK